MLSRRFGRWLGPSGAVFVAACCIAQFVALLDVLGYEYSVLLSTLVSTVGAARVVARVENVNGGIWTRAAKQAVDLLALIGLGVLVSLLNMLRVANCEPLSGLGYAVLFGAGAVPMAIASAYSFRLLLSRRRAWLGLGLLTAASVFSSLVFLALQPPIVAWSTQVGFFAGSIYDESLVSVAPHIWFRLWNAAAALGLLALLGAGLTRSRRDVAIAVAALVATAAGWCVRGDVGWERSRSWIIEELGGHVATEHFDIYFDARSYSAESVEMLAYDHEARFATIAEFFEYEPQHRLRSFVYGSGGQKGDLMGGRRTLVAKIWLGEMHITWDGIGDGLLGHEMAHLFLRDHGRGPLKVSSADGLLPLMALVEGAASAAAWEATDLDDHAWSAAMIERGIAPELEDLLGPTGFWAQNSSRAYTLTSSFSRWLIETRGAAPYLAVYRNGDFEAAYGESLELLVDEWKQWLATERPLSEAMLTVAEWRFDRPSLFGKRCGRALATRLDRAQQLLSSRQIDEARRCFLSVVDDDPDNVGYRLRTARALRVLGDLPGANEQLAWITSRSEAGRAAQLQAMELGADIAWDQNDVAAAAQTYELALAESATAGDRRRLAAKLHGAANAQSRPQTAAAIRRALVAAEAPPAATVVAELMLAYVAEADPIAAYLAALRVSGGDSAAPIELLEAIAPGSLIEEQELWAARTLALQRSRLGPVDQACPAWAALRERVDQGSALAAESEHWLQRCALGVLPSLDAGAGAVE